MRRPLQCQIDIVGLGMAKGGGVWKLGIGRTHWYWRATTYAGVHARSSQVLEERLGNPM